MREETRTRIKRWGKRFGWTAVAFYAVKGMFWLAVGLGAWSMFK